MTNKKIIAIRKFDSNNPDLKKILPDVNWEHMSKLSDLLLFPTVRIGQNILPFKNTLVDILKSQAPDYNINFTDSFSQTSDKRYHELRSTYNDKPWIVLWSGGIDSTVIVTSILKNSSPADRQNIIIACNNASIYEYPTFFKESIQPNFSIINSADLEYTEETLEKYYTFNGHPGDALHCQFSGMIQELTMRDPGVLTLDMRSNTHKLFELIKFVTGGSEEFARWWYSMMLDNINSQNIPVETIHDFFWFNSFNLSYAGTKLRELTNYLKSREPKVVELFWKNYIFWYDSADYQLWSMNNNQLGQKFGRNISDYKIVAKQYIHDYNKDEYYLKFKRKFASVDLVDSTTGDFFCVLDDFTTLRLPEDLELIQQLLPDFYNSK